MTNALSPDHMTPEERLEEVAAILARGILRRQAAAGHVAFSEERDLSETLEVRREPSVNESRPRMPDTNPRPSRKKGLSR
jgi:hypothetical protein